MLTIARSIALTCAVLAFGTAARGETDKYQVTPAERAACQGDAMSLCSSMLADEDRLLACMRKQQSNLSAACRTVFVAGMRRRHLL